MGQVKIDNTRCIGCGACVAIAPDTFDFNDEGLSTVKNPTVTEDAKSASESCPVEAITIEETEEKEA